MRKILIFILCFCTIFLCFVIPSFAYEDMTPRATPTDLTGYTVTVPAGWSATSGYLFSDTQNSTFNLNSIPVSFYILGIGYDYSRSDGSPVPTSDSCLFRQNETASYIVLNSNNEFTLSNITGALATNSAFIQWLVDNNASFGGFIPETSSIPGGVYHFKDFEFLDIPDASWSDGSGYTYSYTLAGKYATTSRTVPFTALNVKFDEYVSASHYTITFSVDTSDGLVNLATYSASYGQVEFEQRSDLKYLVFDEALVGSYDDIEFIRQFLVSGFPDTDTSATDNPWAYILEMIIEALKVDLFGYFSIWDIFTTICGIFIVTWLLKLLAGG